MLLKVATSNIENAAFDCSTTKQNKYFVVLRILFNLFISYIIFIVWTVNCKLYTFVFFCQQPIFFSSTVACYQNCGGRRRYKSSAHIDLFAHSPAVYSVACYTQSCRCSLCCDKTIVETVIARHPIKPNTWHRQRIDALPVSFSLCTIWNFRFLDSESKHDNAKKKKSAQPRTTTTTLTSMAHRPSQLNNDTNNNVKGENVNVEIDDKIGNVNGVSSPQERRYVHKLSIEDSDDPQSNNKSKAVTPQSATPKKKIVDEKTNSSKSNGQINGLTSNGYGRVHETDL